MATPTTGEDSASSANNVLIVDAHAVSREFLAGALRERGCRVTTASRVETAGTAEMFAAPDALLLVAGRDCDSISDVVQQLRSQTATRTAPILVLVESGDTRHWDAALASGAEDVVDAATPPTKLFGRLKILMQLGRTRTELERSNAQRAEQTQTLLALLELSTALNTSESLEELLVRIVTAGCELTRSAEATVLLPDAERKSLVVAEVTGPDTTLKGRCFAIDSGVLGLVLRSTKLMRVRSGPDECRDESDFPWPTGGESVCVPLRGHAQGAAVQCMGMVCVSRRPGDAAYRDVELETLELLGNFAAAAIQGVLARFWRDEARDSLVLALVGLTERRDNDTARHLDRVTTFSTLLVEDLRAQQSQPEIDDQFVQDLRRSVPLHDIGKIAIPDSVLLKPDRLTPQEMEVMKTHSVIGAQTIHSVRVRLPNSSFARMAEEIARHHHEWFDGGGYPDGLAGVQIPLSARIVALADVYDALTTRRVYKPAMTHSAASSLIIAQRGHQFDPQVVDAFLRQSEKFRHYAELLSDDIEASESQTYRPEGEDLPLHWFLTTTPNGGLVAAG